MQDFKQKLDKIIERLKSEISSLRTGRATPALVENLEVDYYGSKTPLRAVASISSPEARELRIQPWDKGAMQAIEHAIQASGLGLNPITDREVIRISIPPLTEERRKELTKILRKHLEDARIQVRREREEFLKSIEHKEKAKVPRPEGPGSRSQNDPGKISENEKFRQKNEVQKIVNEANKKIEEIGAAKEKEIMVV